MTEPEPDLPGVMWSPPFAETASAEELADVMARVERAIQQMPSPAEAMARLDNPMRLPMSDLRTADDAFDASAIARALGISDLELSQGVRASASTLPKTSEEGLRHLVLIGFARVIAAARVLLPDEIARRDWLHRPQPRLNGRTPMQSMLAGGAWEVARGLEMILDGGGGS